jgi:small subunit ribosomal protein S18
MSQFQSTVPVVGAPPAPRKAGYLKTGVAGEVYVDYKAVDDLRRLMTPNGKIYSRKRLNVSAREQRMISQAVKRARYMALLPYTDATL